MKKLVERVEIPTANFSRAVSFYNKAFMLSLQEIDFGSEKMACFPSGEGAIFYKDGYKPSSNGVIVSFGVPDSIESTCARIQQNGGEVVIAKTKIDVDGRGYFALFIDSEGNKIGLYESM